jgi:NitT/TauT family transport system substrate-binding protein
VTPIPEPLWSKFKGKYRAVVVAADSLPPLDNVVGVATAATTDKNATFIRGVIKARQKAVRFMKANPDEAGDIVAKAYNLDRDVARAAVRNLTTSMTAGVPYWGEGQIHQAGLKRMIEAQKAVGAITGDVDYDKLWDTRFLPDDQKAMK